MFRATASLARIAIVTFSAAPRHAPNKKEPSAEVQAAYRAALALDPDNPYALTGSARLMLVSDPQAALVQLARAASLSPLDLDVLQEEARGLIAAGQLDAAETKLEDALDLSASDPKITMELVELRIAKGSVDERTLELATRAVRFGGGADALELLSRVHSAQNHPQLATDAAARAQALRDEIPPSGG
jgi:predicted Zn-dependent protease